MTTRDKWTLAGGLACAVIALVAAAVMVKLAIEMPLLPKGTTK